jgi:hypothetical protein
VRPFSKSIPRKGVTPLDAKAVRYTDLVGSRTKGGMMSPQLQRAGDILSGGVSNSSPKGTTPKNLASTYSGAN